MKSNDGAHLIEKTARSMGDALAVNAGHRRRSQRVGWSSASQNLGCVFRRAVPARCRRHRGH